MASFASLTPAVASSTGLPESRFCRGALLPKVLVVMMTAPAAAHLAIKYGSPLVPVGIRREKGAHFTIRVYPEIALAQTGDRIADTIETTRRLNVYLEDRIRECPEQWLWLHRRWPKTVRPASAPREAADRAAPETS